MLDKLNNWWNRNEHAIAVFATVALCVMIIFWILTFVAWLGTLEVMHDMEAQLAAHGVEWALYTPIP